MCGGEPQSRYPGSKALNLPGNYVALSHLLNLSEPQYLWDLDTDRGYVGALLPRWA